MGIFPQSVVCHHNTWRKSHATLDCRALGCFMQLLVTAACRINRATTTPCVECGNALLVCTRLKHRTLAALTRVLRVPHADQFACADFFRCSAWSAAQVQQALMRSLLQTVVRIQQVTGWRLLFLSVDDALAPKDVATTALEADVFSSRSCRTASPKRSTTPMRRAM